jgi:hypothetical protein
MNIRTPMIPTKLYMVESGHDNTFYLNVEGALMAKEKLDEEYKRKGLSKKAPMFEVGLDYRIYGNRNH